MASETPKDSVKLSHERKRAMTNGKDLYPDRWEEMPEWFRALAPEVKAPGVFTSNDDGTFSVTYKDDASLDESGFTASFSTVDDAVAWAFDTNRSFMVEDDEGNLDASPLNLVRRTGELTLSPLSDYSRARMQIEMVDEYNDWKSKYEADPTNVGKASWYLLNHPAFWIMDPEVTGLVPDSLRDDGNPPVATTKWSKFVWSRPSNLGDVIKTSVSMTGDDTWTYSLTTTPASMDRTQRVRDADLYVDNANMDEAILEIARRVHEMYPEDGDVKPVWDRLGRPLDMDLDEWTKSE